MLVVLVFAITLLIALLFSELAHRSVLSGAVIFLAAGFVVGDGVLGLVVIKPSSLVVTKLAEFSLFSVLFTDGMRVSLADLASAWRLPGRALLFGLPLTLLGTAFVGHTVAGLSWIEAFLVGAILSPTDPVFAAAIVGREEIPYRLRHLLNVESGLNDGLALPLVMAILAIIGKQEIGIPSLLIELASGVLLGVVVPWAAARVEQTRLFKVAQPYEPLYPFAIGLLVLSLASLTHANEFLAAFSAGISLATARPDLRDRFHQFGEHVTRLLKLAALLVFGALISPRFLTEIPFTGYLFAFLALVAVRPVALWVAMLGAQLDWREKVVAYWFGPKGFASVVYGILILQAGIADADWLFHLVAIVILASIVAHSSTDVPIARWFCRRDQKQVKPNYS